MTKPADPGLVPGMPQIHRCQTVAKSALFEVEQLQIRFSNGIERTFERLISHRPSVMVLPLRDPETVVLVQEYAAGLERYEWGLPKGLVDEGESIADAANRELKEEIGWGAVRIAPIGSLALSPSYMTHRTDWVVAWDLYPERLVGDEPEIPQVAFLTKPDLLAWIQAGKIQDVRSVAALMLWFSGALDGTIQAAV